jgi:hypothetical protein
MGELLYDKLHTSELSETSMAQSLSQSHPVDHRKLCTNLIWKALHCKCDLAQMVGGDLRKQLEKVLWSTMMESG